MITVKKHVIENYISDLFENSVLPVVKAKSEIEDENIIVEPPVNDPDFIPVNTVSLSKSMYVLSKSIPQDKIEEFYLQVKKLISLFDEESKLKEDNEKNDKKTFSLSDIASSAGFTNPSGAKHATDRALKKIKFLLTKISLEELEEIVNHATDDYIKYLVSSGELSSEDILQLNKHKNIVSELEGFRNFLSKYIMKKFREKGIYSYKRK